MNANDRLEVSLDAFRDVLKQLGVTVPASSKLGQQLRTVEAYYNDRRSGADLSTSKESFHEWWDAMTVVIRLTESTVKLRAQPSTVLVRTLNTILASDVAQNFQQNQAKDLLYEFEIAAWLQDCGFKVLLGEPDVRVSGNGLTSELAVACKYPSSRTGIQRSISKGYGQISGQDMRGVVAVGMDLLVCQGMTGILEFPAEPSEVMRVMLSELNGAVESVVEERLADKALASLDGALFTLHLIGTSGTPRGILFPHAASLHASTDAGLQADMERLVQSVNSLPAWR